MKSGKWFWVVVKVLLVLGVPLGVVGGMMWWRGHSEWREVKARLVEAGEWRPYEELYLPAVAEEENYFATPLLAGIDDGTRDDPRSLTSPNALRRIHTVEAPEVVREGRRWGERSEMQEWLRYVREAETLEVPEVEVDGDAAAARVLFEAMGALEGDPFGELDVAAMRPEAWLKPGGVPGPRDRLPVHDWSQLPEGLLGLEKALFARAVAAARAGEGDAATASCLGLLHLGQGIGSEPRDMRSVLALAAWGYAVDALWEGLEQGVFSREQLVLLGERFGAVDHAGRFATAMRGELAKGMETIDLLESSGIEREAAWDRFTIEDGVSVFETPGFRLIPGSRFAEARAVFGRLMLEHGLVPLLVDGRVSELGAYEAAAIAVRRERPVIFGLVSDLNLAKDVVRGRHASSEVVRRLAVAACALAGYRQEHGQYPEALEVLVPGRLAAVPVDPFDARGAALRYRTDGDGFVLWSVGPDGVDHLGDPGVADGEYWEKNESSGDFEGDLVWRQGAGGA